MHLHADLVPGESTSEGVAAAFRPFRMSGTRVLLPRAAAAREVIPQALEAMGAAVDVVDVYQNIVPADAAARIDEYNRANRRAHWITFTSGSTVKNWLALAGADALEGVRIASIGPATSDTIRKHGIPVDAEADPHTIPGLVQAILRNAAPPHHEC
jgi:uroporphyrinogen III methyltransferase/synthase